MPYQASRKYCCIIGVWAAKLCSGTVSTLVSVFIQSIAERRVRTFADIRSRLGRVLIVDRARTGTCSFGSTTILRAPSPGYRPAGQAFRTESPMVNRASRLPEACTRFGERQPYGRISTRRRSDGQSPETQRRAVEVNAKQAWVAKANVENKPYILGDSKRGTRVPLRRSGAPASFLHQCPHVDFAAVRRAASFRKPDQQRDE